MVDWWLEGLVFNLCVAPFPNICVPNLKLESEWLELVGVGQRLVESEQSGSEKVRSVRQKMFQYLN